MQQGRHDLLARRHQLDLEAAQAHVVGKFTADQAGPEDQHPLLARRRCTEAGVILQIVDREDRLTGIAFDRHLHGLRAPGQDQVTVGHLFFADPQALVARIDAADTGMGTHFGLELLSHRPRLGHAQAVGILVLGKAGGQHWLGIGTAVIGGNQQQRRLAVELAKFAGQVVTRQASTNNYHRCRHAMCPCILIKF
ncbi:hypothetical protein D3C78_1234350 [compost metagenome]